MNYVFPVSQASVPVVGRAEQFAVHRIYCVGRNYVEHAIEMGGTGREAPFFFMKPADAVLPVAAGSIGEMPYPGMTNDLHHEIELVVAIGKTGRDIPAAEAMSYVWGYAVGLDMTRRDLQADSKKNGRPWCTAKGFDHSAPISPIVTAENFQLSAESKISLEVNGQARQNSTLGKLIWNVAEIIEHLSKYYSLLPGDLIFTGTPAGVAAVSRGDELHGAIDGLGELRVRIN